MSLPLDLRKREIREISPDSFASKHHVTESTIDRLGLETTLKGHEGCVNCLQWSVDGGLLASGSDDCKVIVWQPFHEKPKSQEIRTEHKGNIFSVKFMPHTGNKTVVSGAADHTVQVHDVELSVTATTYANHFKRVKRVDVAQDCPNLIWSASEDGTVMETDIRSRPSETSVLVNLMSVLGKSAEAKCVSVNQRKPELIAVGANDPFVRVYDRRKLKTQLLEFSEEPNLVRRMYDRISVLSKSKRSVNASSLADVAKYYLPGHLNRPEPRARFRRNVTCTYATFSQDGNELLVNLGGEQIYLYDVNRSSQPRLTETVPFKKFLGAENGTTYPADVNRYSERLPLEAEELKSTGNTLFNKEKYSLAIYYYNKAIQICDHPVLYGNRAASLMKRRWDGDMYAALRDCFKLLRVNPGHVKGHLRLCRCLLELNLYEEARAAMKLFQQRFPDQTSTSAYKVMDEELGDAIDTKIDKVVKEEDDGGDDDDDDTDDDDEDMEDVEETPATSPHVDEEMKCRAEAADYKLRFCGHCNTTTDIKEANFFGSNGRFIVAGSDDARFFVWDRTTTSISKVLQGDDSIVNCLQPHPYTCLLASSGIDPVVRLWGPLPEDGASNEREVSDHEEATSSNQRRMKADPFETILLDIGYRLQSGSRQDDSSPDDSGDGQQDIQCRTS